MNIIEKIRLLLQLNKLYEELKEAMMVNWKTTAMGILGALAIGLTGYFESHGVTIRDVVQVLVLSALGYLAKDAGVTGVKK